MRILITGATGLVGRALTARLQARGHEIHYLTTSRDEAPIAGARPFYWNAAQGRLDEAALEGVEAIVHLAGAPISNRWTPSYKQEILESRVLTAKLLFHAVKHHRNHKLGHFVTASAIGLYADDLNHLYTEDDTKYDGGFLGNVVVKWEAAAKPFAQLGMKVAQIRTGLVLAREGGMLPQLARPIRHYVGTAFGSGRQWQSWIHLDDLVGLYVQALEDRWEGPYNAVAPHPVTQNTLVKEIAKILGKPLLLPNVPRFLLKMVLGDMHQLLFTSQKVSAEKVQKEAYSFRFPELQPALDDLLKS